MAIAKAVVSAGVYIQHINDIKYVCVCAHVHVCVLSCFSHVQLFATPWTVAHQARLSMGFSRQEYWSGFPCPPPGDLPDLWTEPVSLMIPALAGKLFTTSATWEVYISIYRHTSEILWVWFQTTTIKQLLHTVSHMKFLASQCIQVMFILYSSLSVQ